MMGIGWRWASLLAFASLAVGCGKSNPTVADATNRDGNGHTLAATSAPTSSTVQGHSSVQTTGSETSPSAQTPAPISAQEALRPEASPEMVVSAFLDATRRGDDVLASQLLSTKALEETSRHGLAVKPPGTPQMTYTIEKVEYPPNVNGGAYVHSIWTERGTEGEESFDIVWVLRKQTEGWRIIGMAAQFSDEEQPYFLNFEQPDDLIRKMGQLSSADNPANSGPNSGASQSAEGESAPQGTARLPEAQPLRR
jgi:hypothetical protein